METKFSSRDLSHIAKQNYGRIVRKGRFHYKHSMGLRVGRCLSTKFGEEKRVDWRTRRSSRFLTKVFNTPHNKRLRELKNTMIDCYICPTPTKSGRDCSWVNMHTNQFSHLYSQLIVP
jgi:hypothetical protein